MSEENQRSHERTKRTYACDSCARRKIKCDGSITPCEWCQIHNLECTFRRNARVAAAMHHLHDTSRYRVHKVQTPGEPKHHLHSTRSRSNPPGNDRDETNMLSQTDHPDHSLGLYSESFLLNYQTPSGPHTLSGIPLFSKEGLRLIEQRTGETVDFDSFFRFGPPWKRQGPLNPDTMRSHLASGGQVPLPDREVLLQHIHTFWHCHLSRVFPLLDETLFPFTIQAAYDGHLTPYSPQRAGATACIFSFMAFISCFPSVFNVTSNTETHNYAFKAQTLISGILLQSPPTLDSIQTRLLLIMYYVSRHGDQCSTDMLLSSTARSLFSLEANKHSPYPSQKSDRFKGHLRNLFWVAYAIDKELSLRSGNPPTLPDDECDLDLPDVSKHSSCYENESTGLGLISFFPNHLPLSILQSQIYNELYSVKAQRKSETELLVSIRKLDHQLEQWKNAISLAQHQTYDDSARSEPLHELPGRFELLEMQHRYCVIAVHQSVSRCRLHTNEQQISMAGIDSSLQVAVSESRLLLGKINTGNSGFRFDRDTFWFHLFYILMSIIAIFSNMLTNPSASECAADVRLIAQTAESINVAATSHPDLGTPDEIYYVRVFISQLYRLAVAAIKRHVSS